MTSSRKLSANASPFTLASDSGMGPRYLNFDPVAGEYDESRYLPPEAQEQAALLMTNIAQLETGSLFLDAGVGTGRFALPLAESGVPVIGVDISEQMLSRLCRKRAEWEAINRPLALRLLRGDLRRLPLASGRFGAALLVHILHLIEDWQSVLNEIRRVLTPGGILILAQESGRYGPTRGFYYERARLLNALPKPMGAESGAQIREWLTAAGAVVEQVDEGEIRWFQHKRTGETIEMLRRRIWSQQWRIPEADHQAIMAATEDWALQMYGSLDTIEETEATLSIWTARWQ